MDLLEQAARPLDVEELDQILKSFNLDVPILLYSDVFPKFENSGDFGKYLNSLPNKGIIILFRADVNFGHWVTVFLRNYDNKVIDNNNLYVFDSLGLCAPDKWADMMGGSKKKMRELGQEKTALITACLNAGFQNVYWNEYELQSPRPEIQTCGRHCVMRLLRRDLNVQDYFKQIRKTASKDVNPYINGSMWADGTPYDYLATALTDLNNPNRSEILVRLGVFYI